MAPPSFPNGMSLYTIGFAALKYPALPPPPVNIPLTNQVGALQHQPSESQNHQIAQIASQYLSALIDYQVSDDPSLNDPSLPQYYFSTALMLLNFLSTSPDVCKRIASHPTLVNSVIDRMLQPDFVSGMTEAPRLPGPYGIPAAKFDDDFGSLIQFISTMFLYKAEMETVHPRISELIPKLKAWKKTYRNSSTKTIARASERLVEQIQGMDETMVAMMRGMQERSLVCGFRGCGVGGATETTLCGSCRVQRYCGREHQRADWKYHKHICAKGLVEPVEE